MVEVARDNCLADRHQSTVPLEVASLPMLQLTRVLRLRVIMPVIITLMASTQIIAVRFWPPNES